MTSLVALAALVGFTSCDQDNIGPKFEGDLNKCVLVQSSLVNGEVDAAENVVSIEVSRLNADGDFTLPIVVESIDEGITIDESVKFADGETSAFIKVTAPNVASLDENKKYKAVFHIPSEYRLPDDFYNTTVSISIRPEPFGTALYNPWLFNGSWDVDVRKARTSNRFVAYEPIAEGYNFEMTFNDDFSELNAPIQDTGYVHPSYGMIFWEPSGSFDYDPATYTLAIKLDYGVSAGYFEDSSGDYLDYYKFDRPLYESGK